MSESCIVQGRVIAQEPDEYPARFFDSTLEAQAFANDLARQNIPHRIELKTYRKRLGIPMQTVVIVLGVAFIEAHPLDSFH